MNSRSRKK